MRPLDESFWFNGLLILAAVALVWIGMVVIQRTRRGVLEDRPERPEDRLAPFEAAYRRGQMSEEEFRRIQQSLGAGLHVPPTPPTPRVAPPGPSQATEEEPPGPLPGAESE
jgi:hypothetical protein